VCKGHLPSRRVTRSCPLIVFDTTDKIPLTTLPLNLLPATVVTDRHTGLTSAVHGPARPTSISTQPLAPILSSTLLVEHAYYRSLLPQDVPSLGDLHDIMNVASKGLGAISRTHFEQPESTHSWTIFSPTSPDLSYTGVKTRCPIPGISSANRLELEGILLLIFLLRRLSDHLILLEGRFTIHCFKKINYAPSQ
jgi:hypothetical protein